MKHAQVINFNEDSVLAFKETDVIDNVTQIPLNQLEVSILMVDFRLWDLMSNSQIVISALTMTHRDYPGYWTVDVSHIRNDLIDRHKYVGKVVAHAEEPEEMRSFQIGEFAVDNDSFEGVLMRLPYEIVIADSEAWFVWYEVDHISEYAYKVFVAPAYEGGVGTTYASEPSRVTHRGAVIPWIPPA